MIINLNLNGNCPNKWGIYTFTLVSILWYAITVYQELGIGDKKWWAILIYIALVARHLWTYFMLLLTPIKD